jgi:hypothetical protein
MELEFFKRKNIFSLNKNCQCTKNIRQNSMRSNLLCREVVSAPAVTASVHALTVAWGAIPLSH